MYKLTRRRSSRWCHVSDMSQLSCWDHFSTKTKVKERQSAHSITEYKLSFTVLIAVWMYECYIHTVHQVLHWKNSEQPPTCPQIGSSAVKKTDELTGFEVLISFLFTEICICDQYLVSCLFSYFLLLKVRSCPPVEISVSGYDPSIPPTANN